MKELLNYIAQFNPVLFWLGLLGALSPFIALRLMQILADRNTKRKDNMNYGQALYSQERRLERFAQANHGKASKILPRIGRYDMEIRDIGLNLCLQCSQKEDLALWLRHHQACQGSKRDYTYAYLEKHFRKSDYKELKEHKKIPSVERWFNQIGPEALSSDGLLDMVDSPGSGELSESATQPPSKNKERKQ